MCIVNSGRSEADFVHSNGYATALIGYRRYTYSYTENLKKLDSALKKKTLWRNPNEFRFYSQKS